jgi:hypothetical protein
MRPNYSAIKKIIKTPTQKNYNVNYKNKVSSGDQDTIFFVYAI